MSRKKKKNKKKSPSKKKLSLERRLGNWAYDKAINFQIDQIIYSSEIHRGHMHDKRFIESQLQGLKKISERPDISYEYFLEEYGRIIDRLKISLRLEERSIQDLGETITFYTQQLDAILSSKPVLIGPATLDSLINQEPESYECIKEGKLPFDFVFFEFFEPFTIELPIIGENRELTGIRLHKSLDTDSNIIQLRNLRGYKDFYNAVLYTINQRKEMGFIDLHFDSTFMGLFFGSIPDNLDFRVNIDRNEARIIKYHKIEDQNERIEREALFEKEDTILSFDEIESNTFFRQISNLCVNIINYINAHNITIIKRKRKFDTIKRTERGKKKRIRKEEPYHLITIKDGFIEESELPTERSWELQWRVYVRGHTHVRGPPDAPWRENRYRDLAAKLEQEKRMYEEHLNKE